MISRTRAHFPSTEMAHRQSGGYKEEPGVAVAGDHVSATFSIAQRDLS